MPTVCQTLESLLLSPRPEVTHPRLQIVNYMEMHVKSIAALPFCSHSFVLLNHSLPFRHWSTSFPLFLSEYMVSVLSAAAEWTGSHWSRCKGLSPAELSGGLPREHSVCAVNHSAQAAGWPSAFRVQAPDIVSWDRLISFHLSELEVNSLGQFLNLWWKISLSWCHAIPSAISP